MTVIAGQLAQAAANTAFLAKGEEIFGRPKEALYGLFTETVACDGQFLEVDAIGPAPVVREIVGSRRFASLRAYARRERVKRWGPDAIERPRLQVDKDKSGLEAKFLADYLSGNANFYEAPVTTFLFSNPVGIDGVSLLNDSHPYAFGGSTWDNKTTGALSPSEFESGISAISGLRLENGEPAGFFPTHLMVGPANRKMAHDLCVAGMRPFPMAGTGLEAYSSALAPTAIDNWMKGQIQVIVNPRFANGTNQDDWLLMDLSRPGAKPILVGEALAPQAHVVDDPRSEPMVQRSAYQYYIEGQAALAGFSPFGIYGKLA